MTEQKKERMLFPEKLSRIPLIGRMAKPIGMVAVTDRHSAYFTLNFLNHQVCVAHLLRELQYLNELDKEQQWSRNVESLLQQAVHERNENPQAVH